MCQGTVAGHLEHWVLPGRPAFHTWVKDGADLGVLWTGLKHQGHWFDDGQEEHTELSQEAETQRHAAGAQIWLDWVGLGWVGMGWDGMGWDGMGWMGWDGMGWDGMGWDGMGWDGMGWDGMGWDGMG